MNDFRFTEIDVPFMVSFLLLVEVVSPRCIQQESVTGLRLGEMLQEPAGENPWNITITMVCLRENFILT